MADLFQRSGHCSQGAGVMMYTFERRLDGLQWRENLAAGLLDVTPWGRWCSRHRPAGTSRECCDISTPTSSGLARVHQGGGGWQVCYCLRRRADQILSIAAIWERRNVAFLTQKRHYSRSLASIRYRADSDVWHALQKMSSLASLICVQD